MGKECFGFDDCLCWGYALLLLLAAGSFFVKRIWCPCLLIVDLAWNWHGTKAVMRSVALKIMYSLACRN